MKNKTAFNPTIILIGEAGHGDLSYGSLIEKIYKQCHDSGLKVQIFSEFESQSQKIELCKERPEFDGGKTSFINQPTNQEELAKTTKFLDEKFIPIGFSLSEREELINSRFKEFNDKNLTPSQVVDLISKENRGNFGMSPKMLNDLKPDKINMENLKQGWGSPLHYHQIHSKMISDIGKKIESEVDVVLIISGFGHSYGIDQKIQNENLFQSSDRFLITNFMKYQGPPDLELRKQIRSDEEKFAPVGNHGMVGFELDENNQAIIPEIISDAICSKSQEKKVNKIVEEFKNSDSIISADQKAETEFTNPVDIKSLKDNQNIL